MKLSNGLVSGIIIIQLFFACQNSSIKRELAQTPVLNDQVPENLWISSSFISKADSILDYYNMAKRTLVSKDTIGAEIYFEQAFEILSHFSEEDRLTLQHWDRYDTLFQTLSEAYEKIYLATNETMEAEEMREDMLEFTELDFPDSVIYGDGTVIDSSGQFPITINNKVRMAIKYFQTKGRVVFTRWLERSGRYQPLIKEIFKDKNIPEELSFLAMIESGYNPKARSYARAVGLWQFISATGRYYGLRSNWWFDERMDPLKSTHAAADHLQDLYHRFGDWYLALAGYNCNPKKVEYYMRHYNSRDFWQLHRLPRQTRNYVPTFLAALIISKNPKKFGFFVDKFEKIEIDTVRISEAVDLNVIAKLTGTNYEEIKDLNPAILRWVTPPGVKDFTLYLPKGKKELFLTEYAKIPEDDKRSWVRHQIKKGETLSTIAQKYHTTISVLKSTNHLTSNFIRTGNFLVIPVPQNSSHYYAEQEVADSRSSPRQKSGAAKMIRNVPGHKKIIYTVKPGDTLSEIAELYNTSPSKIRSWNGIAYGRYIYPNQRLTIWIPENFEAIKAQVRNQIQIKETGGESFYVVKEGDTLWEIARKYNLSILDLKRLNNMRGSFIRPGDRLRVIKN